MLILLSPAKTMEFSPHPAGLELTHPVYQKEANRLVAGLKKMKMTDLQKVLEVNTALAQLNYERYHRWQADLKNPNASAALLSFKGEVFRGLEAWTLKPDDLVYAQDHLRILSGLYGILRPLDLMQPYRLEISTSIKVGRQADLYAFWGTRITRQIKTDLAALESPFLINLVSQEYSKAVDFKSLKVPVIQLNFKDFKDGTYKFLTVYGKHARGMMTRFIVENRISRIRDLEAFDSGGYVFNPRLSREGDLVFTRG